MGTNVHPAELMGVIAFQKLDQIASKQKKRLEENRKLLREVLESQGFLEYFWPEHGTVVFPRVKGNAAKFVERLRSEYELSVVPGQFFEDPKRVRIGVGSATESVRGSLGQLEKALKSFAV